MNNDIETMTIIQNEKMREVEEGQLRELDAETAALAGSKLFSLDVATSEVRADPLR